nr:hypothetical protein [Tanacetum cinerariifolium]
MSLVNATTYQVVLDALALTTCYLAFLITAKVPVTYMHQFWATVTKHKSSNQFNIDNKKFNNECLSVHRYSQHMSKDEFNEPPTEEEAVSLIRKLGYSGEIKYITNVIVDHPHQPWRTFASIINKCLCGKEDLAYQIDNIDSKKQDKMRDGSGDGTDFELGVPDKQHRKTSSIDEGTSTILRVPDAPKYDSKSEKASWVDSREQDDDDENDYKDESDNGDNDDDVNDDYGNDDYEASEEQKQSMEGTMLELVKICQENKFLCIHDDVNDLIESTLNSKLLLINLNSQRLDKKEQEVKNVVEHKSEVTSEDKIECDMPIQDKSFSIFTTFSNPLFNNDDLDFSDDESLSDEDVPAEEFKVYLNPLFDEDEINSDKLDPHCFNVESDFVESLPKRDTFINFSSKFDFSGKLAHVNPEIPKSDFDFEEEIHLIENLLYDNSSPLPPKELNAEIEDIDVLTSTDDVLPPSVENDDDLSNDSLLEEVDLFLASDNSIPPGIENVTDDPEGDIRFLEELLIDDSILSHDSFDFNFEDNPSVPRPPPEPPDVETDTGEEIPVVMNDKDEDVDYSSFIIVMFDKVFSLLFAESEDTIFDP